MFTAKLGALAQLGERLHGMQEVRGSIPLGSTNPPYRSLVRRDTTIRSMHSETAHVEVYGPIRELCDGGYA